MVIMMMMIVIIWIHVFKCMQQTTNNKSTIQFVVCVCVFVCVCICEPYVICVTFCRNDLECTCQCNVCLYIALLEWVYVCLLMCMNVCPSSHMSTCVYTVSIYSLQINDLSQIPVPVMLLPDDFKANTKIKVNNHFFNKWASPGSVWPSQQNALFVCSSHPYSNPKWDILWSLLIYLAHCNVLHSVLVPQRPMGVYIKNCLNLT